ncbi:MULTISPECIES: GNAT family N-acetyltransferase [Rhodanobacter]|uniref:Sortase-like acyltransferase n=1 Tax=Rhodanobacter denitrificans TaxID=666685 RepID=I4WS32_9GAMM|nr:MULTISPECIES: GNAT family N-acetyltransferase [Rhodanobacter]AGG89427.1 sortase-like acyltransferase [Rhodanobacter denitrificans]EIM02274.1 GCN5-like N-acetyltransferase [Rhodanobacter denitrificans]KZC20142.1 GCN5 family acetyltransferase [Rhodanobacter denitrificans]UJJ49632.1 GNAT family N-acetyltransferase [Rhodanobacter denitrificans]UJM88308.1 GNAT family N-acetyltransferase [Rhodanobacter denitrificans]
MAQTDAPPGKGWNEKLQDGTTVQIRSIGEQDAELELEFLTHLSPAFRSSRFLGLVRDPTPEVARELTCLDPACAVGFIALVSQRGREHQIGAAQFHVNAAGDSCDASLTVSDEWRKRGVGSFLMRHLIAAARARGMRHMRAYAPSRSGGGDRLAANIGFQRRLDPRDPATVIYDLSLE